MINMKLAVKVTAAIATFAVLGGVESLYVLSGMMAFGFEFEGAAPALVSLQYLLVGSAPAAIILSYLIFLFGSGLSLFFRYFTPVFE